MKNVRPYLLTFLGVDLVIFLAGFGILRYAYSTAKSALVDSKMESGRRETREVGRMLERQLQTGLTPQQVIDNLEQSIVNTDAQSEFICMYNTAGIELCHPDPALVGQKIDAGNSRLASTDGQTAFSDALRSGKAVAGIRNFPAARHRSSEIVTVYPVKGSNWMVAAHANIAVLQAELNDLYHQFLAGFLLTALLVSGICYFLIRLIYSNYEQRMDREILRLNQEVNSLLLLNRHLEAMHEKIKTPPPAPDSVRRRLVTYQKDQMVSLEVRDIAFISLAADGVTVQTFQNQAYAVQASLDELMTQLDPDTFYRANRQYIINVNAIKTILIYGRNQLQVITHPPSPGEIIISKNKVAEFKKWLDR